MAVYMRPGVALFLLAVLLTTSAGTASAQDSLTRAKALYADAAYQEALDALKDPSVQETSPEVHQYRAMCLAALGQLADAQGEFATIVGLDPFFVLDSRDLSPRFVTMFNDTRRRLLPDAVRRAFLEAKAFFQAGDHASATSRFANVRRLLDDAMVADNADLKSLTVVVDGFADLLSSNKPPPPIASSAAAIDASVLLTAPPAMAEPRATVTTPPSVIKQQLPEWRPMGSAPATRVVSGAVRVTIDAKGRVTSAVMLRRIHPFYDRAVLEAASQWLYAPATLNGLPVASEKTIEIGLSTQ
jgi:TonB family protein